MHVSRIGLAPVKGTRHADLATVELTAEGPLGDRVFCLVDRSRGRVLRTVENPALVGTSARWHDGVLTTVLPDGVVEGVPAPGGDPVEADYWGRTAALEVVRGPWSDAFSDHVGRRVELARATRPGEVVYAGPVSLVTSSSLERLERATGSRVDSAQFRATFTVATPDEPAHVEDSWVGGRLRIGGAEVEVRSRLARCAVVDLDPETGVRRGDVLARLAGYRRAHTGIVFGVDAVVTTPGRVGVGAVVERS